MKPPGWMHLEYRGMRKDRKSLDYVVHVRKWHPGFWLFALRTIWRAYR